MGGLHVAAQAVAMGADGVDELIGTADLRQQLRCFQAVLLRPLFEIHIVEQAHSSPETGVLTVAQFTRIPAHSPLHR